MKGLGSLVAKWLPTEYTSINLRETGGDLVATIGSYGTVRSRRMKNATGQVARLHNVRLLGASPIDLAPSDSEWHDPDMPRNFRTESGGAAKIS